MQATTHFTLDQITMLPVKPNRIRSNDNHVLPHDLEPLGIMIILEFTRRKHPQSTKSVTSYLKSLQILLKNRKNLESRYSCSAPLVISSSSATRIILTLFWRFFTGFCHFAWSFKAVRVMIMHDYTQSMVYESII